MLKSMQQLNNEHGLNNTEILYIKHDSKSGQIWIHAIKKRWSFGTQERIKGFYHSYYRTYPDQLFFHYLDNMELVFDEEFDKIKAIIDSIIKEGDSLV